MHEHQPLIGEDVVNVRLKANGLRFINSVSSSYEDRYQPALRGVVSQEELTDIVTRLNDTLLSFWPCTTCYVFGFVCTPFTLGTSLLCPHYCVSQSDEHAQAMLLNVSLKAKFYDRKITFRIVKQCCDSYVEISFPARLLATYDSSELELGLRGAQHDTDSDTGNVIGGVGSVFSMVAPGGPPARLKDT